MKKKKKRNMHIQENKRIYTLYYSIYAQVSSTVKTGYVLILAYLLGMSVWSTSALYLLST